MRKAVVAVALIAAACGEPAVDVSLGGRDGRHVDDQAGILQAEELDAHLSALAADGGLDIVALTYETSQASCGEAFRAGQEFVEAWGADVAVVAVAQPGDFTDTGDTRQRCLGVQPRDDRAVSGDVRERIAEQIVPPLAARNDWDAAFRAAADELAGS